jgi:2-polyprenyl-6-methoxyphenol hydroxylase-like FAD-dependent oxidoreductase
MCVLICGAGIGGLALALMLGRLGWKTEVVERASGVREKGYMIRLRQLAYPVDELNYVDRNGRPRASLDYQRMVRSLDGRLLSLLRGDLARAIYEDLSGAVKVRFGSSVREVEQTPDEVLVTLTDGRRWSGDLLVGADGIHSTVDRAVGLYAIRSGRIAVFAVHRTGDATLPKDPRAAIQVRPSSVASRRAATVTGGSADTRISSPTRPPISPGLS